jgi:hypothetical protein
MLLLFLTLKKVSRTLKFRKGTSGSSEKEKFCFREKINLIHRCVLSTVIVL